MYLIDIVGVSSRSIYSIELADLGKIGPDCPMLNPELTAFSRFFEIQASIMRKRDAEKSHSDYIKKVSEMRIISSKLDQNKEISNKVVSELKENVEIEDENHSHNDLLAHRLSTTNAKLIYQEQTWLPIFDTINAKIEFFAMDVQIEAGHTIRLSLASTGEDYLPASTSSRGLN